MKFFKTFFERFSYIKALIIKELQIIWSDPKNRVMIIAPPLVQLGLFAFTATLEIKNISMVIYDKDNTEISRALTDKFKNTPTVETVWHVDNPHDLTQLIDRQKAYIAVTIPQDFSKNIYAGKPTTVQFILDGRKSNAAQIVNGYATQIVNTFQYEINGVNMPKLPITVQIRNWFNPNLDYQWFIVITLTGVLAMIMALSITALSVAQEKELGTFDQIIVSPLKSSEILIGKTVPAVLITLMDVTIMVVAAVLFFHIPIMGSLVVLYLCLTVFILAICGIGLFISTLCQTQQQAILGVFVFIAPTFLLSGYITPIENMPPLVQKFSYINPLTYFFNLSKGIYLKDIDFILIMQNTIPLMIIAVITLSFAGWFFNKKLD